MIFIRAINRDKLKYVFGQLYIDHNKLPELPYCNTLGYSMVGAKIPILIDRITHTGILFDKVDISTLVDPDFDITPFKDVDPSTFQLKELTPDEVREWNVGKAEPIVSVYENNFSTMDGYDMDTLKKYAVFCRLLGFFDLDVTEVVLQPFDGYMTITVRGANLAFGGTARIKTW